MAVVDRLAFREEKVRVEIETARGGNLWFEHAQRTGRRVARVGESRQALLVTFRVESLEPAPVEYDFAPYFKSRQFRFHTQRQRTDRACVFRDVFARGSIAARYGLHERSFAILRGHG